MFVLISQIFSILLGGTAISKCYVDFRARRESLPMFVVWTLTWTTIILVAVRPDIVPILLARGGGRAGIGTFLGMGVVFLFFLLYRVYVKLEYLEQKLTTLVQDIALREYLKNGSK